MKKKPSLAYQRKRPRYQKKVRTGVTKPPSDHPSTQADDAGTEENEAPDTMEARTFEAEAAYQFAGQDAEPNPTPSDTPGPPPANPGLPPAQEDRPPGPPPASDREGQRREQDAARREQENQRREAERQRRDQERERREAERKERERRDAERREQQRKEQERRERERLQELRSLDLDGICAKAWDIYSAEVKEEGVELFPDNDARELAKRSFRLAEIFLLEEVRLRKLRAEPIPAPGEAASSPQPGLDGSNPAAETPLPEPPPGEVDEPTMGE